MRIAYVLANSKIGCEKDVAQDLMKIPGIEESYTLYGVYDVLVKVRYKTEEELKEIVTNKIRKNKSIHSTLTLIVYK